MKHSGGNGEEDPGFAEAAWRMVEQQLRQRGIEDERVLGAMQRVPRHRFVPPEMLGLAYADGALPIGDGQTISQPYVVAAMSQALACGAGMRVLEIGTGSGYQTAVLAEMGLRVYTVEFIERLANQAARRLQGLGYPDIHYRCGDGNLGWETEAPFDGIIVTAAPARVPAALLGQLKTSGRLVVPVGRFEQDLRVYWKNKDGDTEYRSLFAVRFVPLVDGGSGP